MHPVHNQLLRIQVQINIHILTYPVHQLKACDTRFTGCYIHIYLECAIISGKQRIYADSFIRLNRESRNLACLFPERFQFPDRIHCHIHLFPFGIHSQFARQSIGTTILLRRNNIRILPIAHPRHGNDTVAGIGKADCRIMVFSPVHPFDYFRFRIADKLCPVEIPDKILRSRPSEQTTRIDIDNQRPFLDIQIPIYRQLHHIRAFELTRLHTVTVTESTHIRPIF